ncbi:S41 family peptidase [Candidatus Cloacimonadota bacterium]
MGLELMVVNMNNKELIILFIILSSAVCIAQAVPQIEYIELPLYPVEELQQDFLQMRKTLEENHANLYEYTSKKEFDELFEQQYKLIQKPMSLNEFFKILTPITAKVGCGHTNLWMPGNFWSSGSDNLFPLIIDFIENQAVVVGYYYSDSSVPLGSIILEINGDSIDEIIEDMQANYSADAMNENFIRTQINRRFSMIYARRYGFPTKFVVTYTSAENESRITADLKPANIATVRQVIFQNFEHPELEFEILEEVNTAVMTIKTFIYYDRVPMFKEYLENCFSKIHEKNIQNLILDLRGNDGGDPFCAAPLLSYLEHEPVPYYAESYGKYADLAEPIPLAEHRFTGNLFTLIDGRCFSTNGHFSALLKYNKIGKFIGTEGGATYKCNAGKNTQDNLNNTGIMVYFGRSTYIAAVQDMDKTQGIMPDHFVEQTYQDFMEGKDTIMEYTLELIKSQKEK